MFPSCSFSLNSQIRSLQNFAQSLKGIEKVPFLAATKQLYKWYFPFVRLSVCLSHLFDYVPIIVSSWNFQELLPMTNVRSMKKVKVKGQGHRGHNPT